MVIVNRDIKRNPKIEEVWRSYLTKGKPPKSVNLPWYESPAMRAVARRLPTDLRCQVCYYPFGGLGGKLVRSFFRLEPSKINPHLCNICERFAENHNFSAAAGNDFSGLFELGLSVSI